MTTLVRHVRRATAAIFLLLCAGGWAEPFKLPSDPSGLPSEWTLDSTHKDPNGLRYRHPDGDYLDFHRGRADEAGWKEIDHWHHNGGKKHLRPGQEIDVAKGAKGSKATALPEHPLIVIPPVVEPVPVPIEPLVPLEPVLVP